MSDTAARPTVALVVAPRPRRRYAFLLGSAVAAIATQLWSAAVTGHISSLGSVVLVLAVGAPHLVIWWRSATTSSRPTITVDEGGLTITDPVLLSAPLRLGRDQVHSVMPLWLRPPPTRPPRSALARLAHRLQPDLPVVRPQGAVPVVGHPVGDTRLVLGIVLRVGRPSPEARSSRLDGGGRVVPHPTAPLRGLLVAVEDVTAAQRAFLPWGVVHELTPSARTWLEPARAGFWWPGRSAERTR